MADNIQDTVDRYKTNTQAACYQAPTFEAHDFVAVGQGLVQLRVVQEMLATPGERLTPGAPINRVHPIPRVVLEEEDDVGTVVDVVACRACGVKLLTLPQERTRQLAAEGAFSDRPCPDCGQLGCTAGFDVDPGFRADTGGHV